MKGYDAWKCTDPRDMEPPEKPERDPDAEYDEWRDEMLDKIITSHVKPPIPTRTFDWSACLDGDEEVGPYGTGCNEAEAIEDLLKQLKDVS